MEKEPPLDSQHLRRFVSPDDIGKLLTMNFEHSILITEFSGESRIENRWRTHTHRIESMTRCQGDNGMYRVVLRRMAPDGTFKTIRTFEALFPGPCSPEDVHRRQFTVT